MKKSTTIAVAAIIVIMMGALLFIYLQGGDTDEVVTADLTIEMYDAPASIHPGNRTVWTNESGTWKYVTEANNGNTVWVFKNITSHSNCYDQLLVAANIAGFTVTTDNQTLGLLVTAIDDISNNDPKISDGQRAWQYLVDDVYANRASNVYSIDEGSSVEWRYTINQFG